MSEGIAAQAPTRRAWLGCPELDQGAVVGKLNESHIFRGERARNGGLSMVFHFQVSLSLRVVSFLKSIEQPGNLLRWIHLQNFLRSFGLAHGQVAMRSIDSQTTVAAKVPQTCWNKSVINNQILTVSTVIKYDQTTSSLFIPTDASSCHSLDAASHQLGDRVTKEVVSGL